mmetsp:Transcript_41574/g.63440  ORF Transcript_41574/g.63440 Transcript_41574/m.63440 type:complete len:94 (-) Transcript_41574:1175-1456(-)
MNTRFRDKRSSLGRDVYASHESSLNNLPAASNSIIGGSSFSKKGMKHRKALNILTANKHGEDSQAKRSRHNHSVMNYGDPQLGVPTGGSVIDN